MQAKPISRRAFVKGSLSALALSTLPVPAVFSQTTIRVRPEWREFRASPNYASFLDAIRIMRANTNGNDRSSWRFWTNVHINYCPHDVAYFLAWHRGYLFYFEEQLRIVSGNNNLVLPYWDYYRYPTLPPEFTDPASGNPLYVPRVNTNVYNALSLAPFDPSVWNFERGRVNAFEPQIESAPHNPVHNIIGGVMTTLESPMDPIFYLHHANIDRLWHAWAMPDGKGIPWATSPYWSGSFTYARRLTLPRERCYHPNRVGTDYADVTPPSSLPPQTSAARVIRVQAGQGNAGGGINRPEVGSFSLSGARPLGQDRRALGGATGVVLAENSVSVRVPIQAADASSVQSIVSGAGGATPYKSVQIVLDDVRLLGAGRAGGYFYKVYLNMPESSAGRAAQEGTFLGTIGPFEIASASHHGNAARFRFQATEVLSKTLSAAPGDLTVSLVRVNGDNSPRGQTIAVGELRVEVSTEEPFDTTPLIRKPANEAYR